MASNPGKVFSRDNLLSSVWGDEYFGDTRTVDTHIQRLRSKLSIAEPFNWDIKTIWGVGYLEIEVQLTKVMKDKKPSQVFKDWLGKRLRFTFSPIVDNHGMVTGSVALVQDISESERLEQLRRDFVANVSHEFRTPLTVIRGSVEALVDGLVENSEDIKRYHHRILSETRGLERLVGDLLELSRLQSGKITINKNRIHISGSMRKSY